MIGELMSDNRYTPSLYADACVLANEVGGELLSRLDWLTFHPKTIVDVGCGPGNLSAAIKKRYEQAFVIPLDWDESMLQFAKEQHHSNLIGADACQLPFKDQSIDLIFANFFLPWQKNVDGFLRECHRALRPEGVLIMSAFGPDTLNHWQEICHNDDLPQKMDMHLLGDLLLQQGFSDPILDVDYYTLAYRSKEKMLKELYATAMLSTHLSEEKLQEKIPMATDGKWRVHYEMIYAHAFKPIPSKKEEGLYKMSVQELKKTLQQK